MLITKSHHCVLLDSAASAHEDLRIVCEDGDLFTSQVLVAAASPWLRSLLDLRHAQEDTGVQTLVLPEVKVTVMKRVVDLLLGGCTSVPDSVNQLCELTELLHFEIRSVDKINNVKQELELSDEGNTISEVVSKSNAGHQSHPPSSSNRVNITATELVAALAEMGGSKLHLDGKNVVCGLCHKMVQIPGERKRRGKVMYFQRTHFKQCLKKLEGNVNLESLSFNDNKFFGDIDDDRDCLEEVWRKHQLEREELPKADRGGNVYGRKKTELPSLESIKLFLTALGGAAFVDGGTKVKCGLCRNKFRVTPGRPIMGNLRYFEKTHLLRCKGRVGESEADGLISDRFCERKFEVKVRKSATPNWDKIRGDLVCSIMISNGDLRNSEENNFEPQTKDKYVSKRKQSLYGANVCFVCSKQYDDISNHYREIHPETSEPFYCLACKKYFSSRGLLLEHLDTDHNFKLSYSCEYCINSFETQSKLNRHHSEIHPEIEVSHSCNMCSKTFSSFPSLKDHQKIHDSKKFMPPLSITRAFTCRFCNIEIMYGIHLEKHIRTEHISDLSNGAKPFYCHICPEENGQSFNEFYYLELHLLKIHGVSMENVCRYCIKSFNNRNRFIEHFKEIHPDENPFECPRWGCGKTMSMKGKLKDHLIMHMLKEGNISEEMKMLCNECGKVFYIKKKLDEHVRLIHKKKADFKEKKYQCHHCIKAFFSNSQLQEHIRKHEGNPGYVCDLCGKGFYRKDRLAIHSKTVHLGEKNFGCTMCDKKFVDNYKLKRHLKTHDSVKNSPIKSEEQTSLLRKRSSLRAEDPQLPKYEPDTTDQRKRPTNHSTSEMSCDLGELTLTQYLSKEQLLQTDLVKCRLGSVNSDVLATTNKKIGHFKSEDPQYLVSNQLFQ